MSEWIKFDMGDKSTYPPLNEQLLTYIKGRYYLVSLWSAEDHSGSLIFELSREKLLFVIIHGDYEYIPINKMEYWIILPKPPKIEGE